MAKEFKPKVATSNHLLEGDVIYYFNSTWTRDLKDAQVAHTQKEADALLAEAKKYPLETVGVELVDVIISNGVPTPSHFREQFRTTGPSNYFHGKQAEHV